MSSFTNYPILIAESMNPFIVSVAFKCEFCGKVSKTLEHTCFKEEQIVVIKESFPNKIRRLFSSVKPRTTLEN